MHFIIVINYMILILLSPEKSVVLTGPAGVGKTSLVEGLALMIQHLLPFFLFW